MHKHAFPSGFIAPCLPTKAQTPPSGALWLHEIKHDGFRVVARKDGDRVRLYSRPGNDLTYRFPLIVESLARLRSRSCIIDGEAVACDDDGMPSFNRIRYRRHDASVFLYAFDLIELKAMTCGAIRWRRARRRLSSVVAKAGAGIRYNGHIERTVRLCLPTLRRASRASCRSGRTRPTARAARRTGSSRRTRRARQ
jgi:ATP-dependent DNA ligase